ncbi:gfo/Idh/MocA family oxidoreductase [Leptospira gomenensis]|uniref:Gfo/Idh/MocA family oxidoreductase n=1 Tax=Leptospira gomenensis TaxID=2484974 RepID=A0A5F1Y825_9LEPT|nr:gfo/Idh/MocA family oxidoreductase [Leptospira gomenensis]TGK30927.1 gfo/Idh/MocA family oxidoreductase [Leptospira gomenensis]TGK45353.1 gfo/Idh/MocA family oxidoreductase [Leptospira gomenensis]TGK66266.1 gfo/Idh/MocA family oxidoreductase [Leptospira gomenensis]
MSDHLKRTNVLLVGTGYMGAEYARVLNALKIPFRAVGRSRTSCDVFFEKTGVQAIVGGLENFLTSDKDQSYSHAIVSSNTEFLGEHSALCLKSGIHKLLVEKPGGITTDDIEKLYSLSSAFNGEIFIAYNRRFYSSVIAAQRMIEDDRGVTSFTFDFTEWPHTIESLSLPILEKRNWVLRNSSHVIDLAFHLCGRPIELIPRSFGGLDWTPKSIFVGVGVCENHVPFSYHSNWESAGRWGLEIQTKNRKIIFRPLEKLHIQMTKSVSIEEVVCDESGLDRLHKPGLYLQVKHWLEGETVRLCSLREHLDSIHTVYGPIAGFRF